MTAESVLPARPRTGRPRAIYRPRRPAATILHRTVREHLETFLAVAQANRVAWPEMNQTTEFPDQFWIVYNGPKW